MSSYKIFIQVDPHKRLSIREASLHVWVRMNDFIHTIYYERTIYCIFVKYKIANKKLSFYMRYRLLKGRGAPLGNPYMRIISKLQIQESLK